MGDCGPVKFSTDPVSTCIAEDESFAVDVAVVVDSPRLALWSLPYFRYRSCRKVPVRSVLRGGDCGVALAVEPESPPYLA